MKFEKQEIEEIREKSREMFVGFVVLPKVSHQHFRSPMQKDVMIIVSNVS